MKNNILKNYFIKKYLGQNFLINKKIIKDIISIINPKNEELLIEIGPGLGALTFPILYSINKLYGIEIDHNLIMYLNSKKNLNSKLIIFEENVLNFNFEKFSRKNRKLIRVFGNIPYNISTKIIFHIFNFIDNISDIYFTLQKEVADRLCAIPGTKKYGKLSVMTQYFCKVIPILKIKSNNFYPTPKVTSMLVHLIPHKKKLYSSTICIEKSLKIILREAFSKRRKLLYNSLNNIFNKKDFDKLNINSKLRPENLSVAEYCKLAFYFKNM